MSKREKSVDDCFNIMVATTQLGQELLYESLKKERNNMKFRLKILFFTDTSTIETLRSNVIDFMVFTLSTSTLHGILTFIEFFPKLLNFIPASCMSIILNTGDITPTSYTYLPQVLEVVEKYSLTLFKCEFQDKETVDNVCRLLHNAVDNCYGITQGVVAMPWLCKQLIASEGHQLHYDQCDSGHDSHQRDSKQRGSARRDSKQRRSPRHSTERGRGSPQLTD